MMGHIRYQQGYVDENLTKKSGICHFLTPVPGLMSF